MAYWKMVKLEEVTVKVGSGATPRGGSEIYQPTGTPLIRSMNVHFDGFKKEGLAYIDDEQAKLLKSVEVSTGDVLLNITGASIGRVTQAPKEMNGSRVNQHVCIIRTCKGLESSFLAKFLASPKLQEFIMAEESGATRQALTKEKILSFEVPLPPLAEQRRIVAKIDALFERSRRARQFLEAIPPLLEKFRQSVLAAAFRGDLTKEWREKNKGVEPASALLERIRAERRNRWKETELAKLRAKGREPLTDDWKAKYVEPEPVDTSDLPELPEGWAWGKVGEIVKNINYGYTASSESSRVGPKFLRITDLSSQGVDWPSVPFCKCEQTENYSLKAGDIVVARTGATTGKSYLIKDLPEKTVFASYLIRLSTLESFLPLYLSTFMQSPFYWEQITNKSKGTAQPGVNADVLSNLYIPVAPIEEQEALLDKLVSVIKVCQHIEKEMQTTLNKVSFIDQSILSKAFRGKLVPQDPNDEPALVLLERIRAERTASEEAKDGKKTKPKPAAKQETQPQQPKTLNGEQPSTATTTIKKDEEGGRDMVQMSLFE